MGGSSTKIVTKPFDQNNPSRRSDGIYQTTCNERQKIRRIPLTFNNISHVRCIFFTQQNYNDGYHIPKETLSVNFNSTINNLENDIESNIRQVYNNVNAIVPGAKILNPIYIAFARTLHYTGSIFDDPTLEKIKLDMPTNTSSLAIKDFIMSYLNKMQNPDLDKKYASLPMNSYEFVNNQIKVIMYFPFMTNDYKYITNFKDIINSSTFFTKLLLDTEFNGLPDVNTFNEDKMRIALNKNKALTPDVVDYLLNKMKQGDEKNFRFSDDLKYLCNEGGCLSEIGGEDFTTLLPSLGTNDSDNNNVAFKMSPFLPNKCLAQTFRLLLHLLYKHH